jgi:hypothetical protein
MLLRPRLQRSAKYRHKHATSIKNDEQRDENNENVDVNDSITIKLSRND